MSFVRERQRRSGESDKEAHAEDRRAEVPVDENNHALAALRYLIAALDRHTLKTRPKIEVADPRTPEERAAEERERRYAEMAESDDPGVWWGLG